MNKQSKYDLIRSFAVSDPEAFEHIVNLCDGHTLFNPDEFTKHGMPKELAEAVTMTYESDFSSPKSTIHVPATQEQVDALPPDDRAYAIINGMPVKSITGIEGLAFLKDIVTALKLEYEGALGRGKEARNIQVAIYGYMEDHHANHAETVTQNA